MKTSIFASVFAIILTNVAGAQITAIRAGKVVDPVDGSVAVNQTILVEGRDIKEIGLNLRIPDGAVVIDLSRQTLMPGMFDAHTHLCMIMRHKRDGSSYYITSLRDSNAARAIQGVVNAKSMLDHGFTTVRDIGNEGNYACSDVREAINQGMVPGPLIINAGRIIAPYGGQFQLQADKKNLAEPEYFFADTRDEMRKAIRENIHYGAQVIKIVVDDQRYIYSVDDIKYMVEETHAAGLKLAAHCWTRQGARNAGEAGVDSIEHGVEIDDASLEIAKQKGIPIVPVPFTEIDATLGGTPGGNKQANKRWFIDPVKRAYKIGAPLVWGPDVIIGTSQFSRGFLSIDSVDEWVAAGIPAKVILQALTTNAAKLLGVESTRGRLKAGMRADIVAVSDNPLEKITTLKKVVFVMRNGNVHKSN